MTLALITGASSGIGLAYARALAAAESALLVGGNRPEPASRYQLT